MASGMRAERVLSSPFPVRAARSSSAASARSLGRPRVAAEPANRCAGSTRCRLSASERARAQSICSVFVSKASSIRAAGSGPRALKCSASMCGSSQSSPPATPGSVAAGGASPGSRALHPAAQVVGRERLDHEGVDSRGLTGARVRWVDLCGQGDDRRPAMIRGSGRQGSNAPCGFEAVDVRQADVHQHDVDGVFARHAYRVHAGGGDEHPMAAALQQRPCRRRGSPRRPRPSGWCAPAARSTSAASAVPSQRAGAAVPGRSSSNQKRLPPFRARLGADLAAHPGDQRSRYGEAESGPLAPVGGVGMDLRERLEQPRKRRLRRRRCRRRRPRSAVAHGVRPLAGRRPRPSLPRRELHRVADEVEQHLLDLAGIAEPVWRADGRVVPCQGQADPGFDGARTHDGEDAVEHLRDSANGAHSISMRPASMRL